MKSTRVLPLLWLAAGLLSCSSTPPPQVAYDHAVNFTGFKTFDWWADPSEEKSVGGAIVDARWVDDHVKAAVVAELEKKGLRPAGSGTPDFYVDYHTRSGGVMERDQYGAYSWWTGMGPIGAQYYKQAILVLDVRDPAKKLVWRGSATETLGQNPEQLDKQIRKLVADLFRDFPPGEAAKS
jgi:Domain of unknown function (DUF4136)